MYSFLIRISYHFRPSDGWGFATTDGEVSIDILVRTACSVRGIGVESIDPRSTHGK